jgi:hypothetical protein
MTRFRHSATGPPSALEPVRIGAYLHSAHELFRVEGVNGERALVENCRSGDLIDVPVSELAGLEPVRANDQGARRAA